MANQKTNKGKNQPFWRRLNKWLHLWLGLGSGIIVFIVCLTGTIFVFHEEINAVINHDALYVEIPKDSLRMDIDMILENIKTAHPQLMISQYTEYRAPERSIMLKAMNRAASPLLSLSAVYVNPYSGEVLKTSQVYGFFRLMVMIHINLLLGKTGSYIVQIATIIFLLELISGIIWWWPKKWSKTNRKKSFTIKSNASWKRINLDLHNVLGFYAFLLAFVFTITALIICYAPVKSAVFSLFGSTGKEPAIYRIKHPTDSNRTALPLEVLLAPYRKELSNKKQLTSTLPSERSGTILVRLEETATLLTFEGEQQFVDQYSGEKIKIADDIQQADRLLNKTISLHIGAWYGMLGKTLTFVACLICTSLPITGFIIWYNRKFKKRNLKLQYDETTYSKFKKRIS